MSYKIAIIGPKEAIICFKAAGLVPFFCANLEEGLEILFQLRKKTIDPTSTEKYAIIFILEDLLKIIPEADFKKLTMSPLPAIIALPSHKGSTGLGLARLNKIVERAVGTNILG